jgi:hypothetical protein
MKYYPDKYYPDTFDHFPDDECLVLYNSLQLMREVAKQEELPIVLGLLEVLNNDLKLRNILP